MPEVFRYITTLPGELEPHRIEVINRPRLLLVRVVDFIPPLDQHEPQHDLRGEPHTSGGPGVRRGTHALIDHAYRWKGPDALQHVQ